MYAHGDPSDHIGAFQVQTDAACVPAMQQVHLQRWQAARPQYAGNARLDLLFFTPAAAAATNITCTAFGTSPRRRGCPHRVQGTSDTSHAIPLLTPRLAISAPADSLIFVAQWRRPAPHGAGSQVDLVTVAAAGASAGTNVDCPAGASTSPLNGTPDICASPSTVSDTSSALAEGGSWSIAIAAPSGGATPVPTLALLALVLAAAGALVAHRLAGRWPRAGAGRSPGSPARYPPRVTIVADPDRTFVSCLMAALPSPLRLPFFRRSVADYCRQSHPTRELVVVLDRGDPDARDAMIAHVESLGRDDVRVIEPDEKLTLGALRNVSVAEARGDVMCHWDDDDWFHPERVRPNRGTRARGRAVARAGRRAALLPGRADAALDQLARDRAAGIAGHADVLPVGPRPLSGVGARSREGRGHGRHRATAGPWRVPRDAGRSAPVRLCEPRRQHLGRQPPLDARAGAVDLAVAVEAPRRSVARRRAAVRVRAR
ncbi:MAG: glycosyltransferase [Betaproteobacteria bacterium]|nr:glycosyltransferase [Betaproteobacteria bacterium]